MKIQPHRIRSHFGGLTFGIILLVTGAMTAQATLFVYVASSGNNTVYALPADTFGGAAVGAGQVFANGFSGVYSVASLNGNVYMANITSDGNIYRKAATAGGAGTGTLFANTGSAIYDMTFADANNLHVVGGSTSVTVISSAGATLGTYSLGAGAGSGGIDYSAGDGIYATRLGVSGTINRLTGSGTGYSDSTSVGLAADSFTPYLQQIVKDANGFLYVAAYSQTQQYANTIYQVNPTTGAIVNLFPTSTLTIGLNSYTLKPVGVEIGPDGELYFANYDGPNGGMLFRVALDGSGLPISPEIIATGFSNPVGIAFVNIIPEPSMGMLVALGGLMLWRLRRDCRLVIGD